MYIFIYANKQIYTHKNQSMEEMYFYLFILFYFILFFLPYSQPLIIAFNVLLVHFWLLSMRLHFKPFFFLTFRIVS